MMFKNYLITAYRNLRKRFGYSLINILGLATGMAVCILILQYVNFELSYDDFFPNKETVFRIRQDRYDKGELSTQWVSGCAAVGQFAKTNFPEVEDFVRLRGASAIYGYINEAGQEKSLKEERAYSATPSIFNVFSIDLIHGDENTALNDPFQLIISEKIAKKYFGEEDPIGKTMTLDRNSKFTVTGIFPDFPDNSHFRGEIIISYATVVDWQGEGAENAWNWDGFYNYVKINPNTDYKVLEKKITEAANEQNKEDWGNYNHSVVFYLQPLTDIHLYSDFIGEFEPGGNGNTVYFLLIISFFVIIIAWINYINLSTARSVDRAREVGVRKVMGSNKQSLIYQFIMETALTNLIAIILAGCIVVLALPYFSDLIGREISFTILQEANFWIVLCTMFFIGTILAGIYPAFVLSSFTPVVVLKGKMRNSRHGIVLRKGLVVFQFAASIVLMIGTVVVYQQVNYMQTQDLGVNIEQTLVLDVPMIWGDSTYPSRAEAYKHELKSNPNISEVAFSTEVPGRSPGWNAGGIRLVTEDEKDSKQYRVIAVDYDFVDMFGLEVVEGRKFSEEYPNDKNAVLFNEAGAKQLGFENYNEMMGEELFFWGDTFQIVGVLKNYHQSSLQHDFEPLIFRMSGENHNYYSIKVNTAGLSGTIAEVEKLWKSYFPEKPFEYFFLDDRFNQNYAKDILFGKVFLIFSSLALLIACMGLFGLASYTTSQRTKEIGIRKILGATISSILMLLSREFTILVLIAFVIGAPISYFLMDLWLQDFAYKTPMSWWLFVLPGVTILFIALLSVISQALKAAFANLSNSLRYE
ncbi:ABC transporter permease [Chondrinema litorale]|uniref:ABC transporter permease n=1 Tax=Chondrinema litorale TaxID=2994555 RepID=UPI0025431B53|nr:ABC transporter permease [Chondrinema litorale]UZR97892.1 ABC transporter permease [Chondrinema litorale]